MSEEGDSDSDSDSNLFYGHPSVRRVPIPNKGYGYVATEQIPVLTTVIKETPYITIPDREGNPYERLLLIYYALIDPMKRDYFTNLHPQKISVENHQLNQISRELLRYEWELPHMVEFLRKLKKETLALHLAKFSANAFGFTTEPVIFKEATYFNHSCYPNVIYSKVGDQMVFKTIRKIEQGEELTISYIDVEDNVEDRKVELRERYGFECTCVRCSKQNSLLDTKAIRLQDLTRYMSMIMTLEQYVSTRKV